MRPQQRTCPFCASQDPLPEVAGAAAAVVGLHRQAGRERARAVLAELLVDPPAPGSDREFQQDVAFRSEGDLRRERGLLRLALLLHSDPPTWWVDRLAALEAEMRRRRG